MEDIRSVLLGHRSKNKKESNEGIATQTPRSKASTSEIPDLFFDEILNTFKLTRIEIQTLMYMYRRVWCKPNAHKVHGISEMMDMQSVASDLDISFDELYRCINKLQSYGFIDTIRSGQYFVRKYFTEEFDQKFGIGYDNFF